MSTATYGATRIKRKRRTKAEIEALEEALYDLAAELRPCTVRQLFYQAVSKGLVDKTENQYDAIGKRLVLMRRSGKLPYSWLADHTRYRHKPNTHSNLENMLELSRETYRRAIWSQQPRHVEIWIEKAALIGVVWPITSKWDVPLLPTRGYPSLTFLYEAAEEILEIDKPTSIFYFGDHDPSGVHIPLKIEEELRNFAPDVDLTFDRIAVNEHQILDWNLPTRPTKKSDSRSKNFNGDSVELDAIPPQQLRDLCEECIEQHIDEDILERTKQAERLERGTLQHVIDRLDMDGEL